MRTLAMLTSAAVSVCLLSIHMTAHAQTAADYEQAEKFAAARDIISMEAAYDAILVRFPNDRRALIGRATARSWAGNRDGARADYNKVLLRNPDDLEALTGLGYDYAWEEDFDAAEETFRRAEVVGPDNLSVRKGLAYTRLWRGNTREALASFKAISVAHPEDAEAYEGLGQANLKLGHAGRAEMAFNQALRLDPDRAGAREGRTASYSLPPALESSLWVGNSAEGGDIGIRSAELASWFTPRTRVGIRYDNSLSLDNPALARSGEDAQAVFASVQHQFGEKFIGVAEIGSRDLPDDADQQIYKAEGVFLAGDISYKIGGQLSPHSDGFDDTLFYGGANFPLAEHVRMDATLFFSETGVAGDEEIRGALFAEYKAPSRWTIGAGAALGDISSDTPGAGGNVTTAHMVASAPVAGRHTAYILTRWESSPLNEYTTVMVGFTLRLPRR